jgi:hypothetical protein
MDIGDLLKALPEMNRTALCQQWQERFNKPAPDGVRKELLVRMLAYRAQEQAFGGLSARSRRRLDEMAAAISSNPTTASRTWPAVNLALS